MKRAPMATELAILTLSHLMLIAPSFEPGEAYEPLDHPAAPDRASRQDLAESAHPSHGIPSQDVTLVGFSMGGGKVAGYIARHGESCLRRSGAAFLRPSPHRRSDHGSLAGGGA